ncbi:hypothetical protein [Saccharopolyspora phatthalungensis]|uniref:Uncharacterized protein n=1 Tax=Saccharopolyspora phatthalungensis TaxID=664693 RepID=A0A840PUD8_9PSEU|nr:hypothetical protein [Saccharopolyspora phatthalungensis]MBB5153912.1 hypothetical protein [Saccharopolyspora phatthalungensis]
MFDLDIGWTLIKFDHFAIIGELRRSDTIGGRDTVGTSRAARLFVDGGET